MPRPPALRVAAVADLYRQLAYAPEEARRREMKACEALIAALSPQRNYPDDFVVFRITGFRPERPQGAAVLVGEALIADLSAFVQRLSQELPLAPDERPGGATPLPDLAQRLGTTVRTLQRWRRLGLVQHWIEFPGLGRRLGCFEESLRSFATRHPELVRAARGPRRLTAAERKALVEEAREVRAAEGAGRGATAKTLARRHGRAPETVRQVLLRHDASSATPVFERRQPMDERRRRLIERAWRRGIGLAKLAERLGRSVPAIHRQLLARRRERLAGLSLSWIELPTFALPDADAVILAAPAVRRGLVRRPAADDALELLRDVRSMAPLGAGGEAGRADFEARVAAMNFLLRRAARSIAALPPAPSAARLDGAETDLRWAALLKQCLVAALLPDALRRADAWAGRPVERLPAEEIRWLAPLLVHVCREVVERLDVSRGQRADRLAALATDKELARRGSVRGDRLARAAATHASAVAIADPWLRLSQWQEWLDPPPAWRERLASLPPRHRRAVSLHHGLEGEAPRSLKEVAAALGSSPSGAARLVQEGEAMLRRDRRCRMRGDEAGEGSA